MYSKTVMDHFMNPRNVGEIENPDGIGEVGNPVCGDIMKIFLRIENDRITDAKFMTFGCGAAIASSSMATKSSGARPWKRHGRSRIWPLPRRSKDCPPSRCTVRFSRKRGSTMPSTTTGSGTACRPGRKRAIPTMESRSACRIQRNRGRPAGNLRFLGHGLFITFSQIRRGFRSPPCPSL